MVLKTFFFFNNDYWIRPKTLKKKIRNPLKIFKKLSFKQILIKINHVLEIVQVLFIDLKIE